MGTKVIETRIDEKVFDNIKFMYSNRSNSYIVRQAVEELNNMMFFYLRKLKIFKEKEIYQLFDIVNGWELEMLSETNPAHLLQLETIDIFKYEGNKYDLDKEVFIDKIKNLTEMEALTLLRFVNYWLTKNIDEKIDVIEEMKKIIGIND